MPVSHRVLSSVLACVLSSATALAQEAPTTNAECARAYEDGQVQRKSGRLVEARSTLQLCARDECPDFIRADCVSWYGEVQGEVPTLVFAARSQGRDLADVRISLGDRVMAARLDGQAIELDPGEYDFRFEAAGMQPLTQRSVGAQRLPKHGFAMHSPSTQSCPSGQFTPSHLPAARQATLHTWPVGQGRSQGTILRQLPPKQYSPAAHTLLRHALGP
jgi:hypothetical protein